MTTAAINLSVPRRAVSPWIVAAAVVIPTFMEVLDTTIANVALRYIAGGLSAAATDSEWVITSYLAANAIILPISGWLGARLGRRNYFLLSITVFTIASMLCGCATSLGMLIACRVLQGLAGGGLQPSSQGVLLDAFPPEQQGSAMTLFGLAALLAPVVGPTLGGYITDNYGWRWIFYLNVPVGILAVAFCSLVVVDPEYMQQARAKLRKLPLNFDTIGLCLLAVTMCCWEIVLSKGQEWDWFGDPFYRVQTLSFLFAFCLICLIFRELRIANPLVNFRTLLDRNFRACCIIIFCAYGVLYANTTTLPALLQTLFGYDATTSGLVLSPSGVFAVMTLLCIGALMARGVDARLLMGCGLLTLAIGNYWLSLMNLQISPWQVVWPRVVVIAGLSMLFAPLNVAAFVYIPKEMRGAAVGLLALLRNEGGSVGTSVAQTILERREQFHTLRLNESLTPLNPAVTQMLASGHQFFLQLTGDPHRSDLSALQFLANLRDQQATSLAYFDVFWFSAALAVFLVLLVFLMKRSVAEKERTSGRSELFQPANYLLSIPPNPRIFFALGASIMPDTPSQRATIQGQVSVVPVAKPLRPHFLELLKGVSAAPRYELNKEEMVLGREPGVDLMLSGDQVSRRHALLRRRNQEYTIIDLDSSHGIYLNGVKVHSALLRDEDVLQLADVVFVYHEA